VLCIKLRQGNAQLALAGRAALVGSYAYNVNADMMRVSEGCAAIHGLPEGTIETTRSEWRTSGKLVQHHCHCLTSLRAQNDLWTADLVLWRVAYGASSCRMSSGRYPLPSARTQQLMCCPHRAKASVECLYEVGDRSAPNRSLGNHGANGREGVLPTVVSLGDQHVLPFLSALRSVTSMLTPITRCGDPSLLYEMKLRGPIRLTPRSGHIIRYSKLCSHPRSRKARLRIPSTRPTSSGCTHG
jgi:hypothetical protein